MNREAWLETVTRRLRPWWRRAGYEVPTVRVSCGWPSEHATESGKMRSVGECWNGSATRDGIPQIFVSPAEDDSVKVAGIVAHELLHATLSVMEREGAIPRNAAMEHKHPFQGAMKALGFVGRPMAAHPGPELKAELKRIVESIGPYPHSAIRP